MVWIGVRWDKVIQKTQRQWTRFLVFCTLVIVGTFYALQLLLGLSGTYVKRLKFTKSVSDKIELSIPSGPYDILLNSYMRSGSSFTGKTISSAPDTFYVYEPLYASFPWQFLKGPFLTCNYSAPICQQSNQTSLQSYNSTVTYLGDIFACNLRPHIQRISKFIVKISAKTGTSWDGYKRCVEDGGTRDECIHLVEESCRKSTHRAAKVLRITLDNLEPLLSRHKRLKVVHLLRDPRGIMRSHVMTRWFPVHADRPKTVEEYAMILCQRMEHDLKAGKRLQELYPFRFRFVQYEDIVKAESMAELMKYLDLYQNNVHSSRYSKPGYDGFSYRSTLPYNITQQVDRHCAEVYAELGLRKFANEDEYLNKSVDVVLGDLPFRMKNSESHFLADFSTS